APAMPTAAPDAGAGSAPPAAGILQAMQSPQGQDFTRTMMRGMMAQMYPDIAEEMNISQEEEDPLYNRRYRRQLALAAASQALMGGNVHGPAARQEEQPPLKEKQQELERKLAAHLDRKHDQWEENRYTAAEKQQVSQLETVLA